MKKIFLIVAVVAFTSFVLSSCKPHEKCAAYSTTMVKPHKALKPQANI